MVLINRSRMILAGIILVLFSGLALYPSLNGIFGRREVAVGVSFPRSGSASPTALNMQHCVLWAIDYFNSRQKEYRIIPLLSDDPVPGNAVPELVYRGARAIFGGSTSAQALDLLASCSEYDVPLISPASSASSMAVEGDLLYRGLHDSHGPGKLAGRLAREKGMEGYMVFSVADNGVYGDSFSGGFAEGAEMPPLGVFQIQGTLPDDVLTRVLDEKRPFDTAILVLPTRWSCLVAHQLKLFYPSLDIWIAGWGSSPAMPRLGGGTMEGIRQTGAFRGDLYALDHPYIDFVKKHYADEWDSFALDLSFRAVALLVAALEQERPQGGDLASALNRVESIEGLYGTLDVNRKGDVVAPLRVAEIRSGRWIDVTREMLP